MSTTTRTVATKDAASDQLKLGQRVRTRKKFGFWEVFYTFLVSPLIGLGMLLALIVWPFVAGVRFAWTRLDSWSSGDLEP
jgi:hypothetical protein